MNLASNASTQRSLQFHYDWAIFSFLLMAALRADAYLEGTRKLKVWSIVLFLALATYGRWPGFTITHFWPSREQVRCD